MNTLYIDTRDNSEIVIRLDSDGDIFELKSEANKDKAQNALPMIEQVLSKAGIKVSDIDEINVEAGSGSYTGVRVGVAIANALSFSGSIKLNGKESDIVVPEY